MEWMDPESATENSFITLHNPQICCNQADGHFTVAGRQ